MRSSGAAARIGTELAGTYQLRSVLGQGGMGVVYEAEHSWTGRRVAVKVIACDGAEPQANLRALNEARLATQLRHPNVVDVLDMGEDEPGVVYLAMEYLEGRPLSALLQEQTRLDPGSALELLLPIMGAVATAHDAGILHRDLKPSNLFVSERRGGTAVPKLLDFGIAKVSGQDTLTKPGVVVGTPHYMAPEQASDGETSPATDTWALGVVMHECLRGQRPYDSGSATAILLKIVNAPAPRLHEVAPWVPKALAAVVDRALEREPRRRFESAREFARALLAAAVQDGIRVPDDPDPIGLPDWKRWRSELDARTVSTELSALGSRASDGPEVTPPSTVVLSGKKSGRRNGVPLALGIALSVGLGVGVWLSVPDGVGSAPPANAQLAQAQPAEPAAVERAPIQRATPPALPVALSGVDVGRTSPSIAKAPPAPRAARLRQGRPKSPSPANPEPVSAPASSPASSPAQAPASAPQAASASGIPGLVHEW